LSFVHNPKIKDKQLTFVSCLFLLTVIVCIVQLLGFERRFILDLTNQDNISTRDDRVEGGSSISSYKILHDGVSFNCQINKGKIDWQYCELKFILSSNKNGKVIGLNLSGYDRIGLWIDHDHKNQPGTRIELHNFSDKYSIDGVNDSLKYNTVEFFEDKVLTPTWIKFHSFYVPTWWSASHDLADGGTDFTNIYTMSVTTGGLATEGLYKLTVKRIEFRGRYIENDTLFLLSLALAFIYLQRRKVVFERIVSAQLENKVAERTVELEAKNQKIEAQINEVEEKNKEILATQKQLIQSSKMASIGTMTAGVAHEINNPTNFAHVAAYMMQHEIIQIKAFLKQLAGGDKAEPEVLQSFDEQFTKLIELTKTMSEGTTRIKSIVEDLRTFTRIDDTKQAQIQVSDLINSTLHLVQTQYDAIAIETQFNYEPLFMCFPSKLNQVFMNIIVNACHAIESKNTSTDNVEGRIIIKTDQHDNRLIITFEDNGCGMTKQTMERIFEPFFTTKDVGNGTGLGMAISFGIIEEHSGTIEVESAIDVGSKIIISFEV